MKRILKELAAYKGWISLSLLTGAVSVFCTILIPVLTGDAVDCIIGVGQVDFAGLRKIFIYMAAAISGTAVSQYFMNRINNRITYGITMDLRNRAQASLNRMPISEIDKASQGDFISRIIVDADAFSDGLLMGFTQFFTGILTIIGTLIFMFYIRPGIALVVVLLTPLSLFVAKFIATHSYAMFKQQAADRGALTDICDERISQQRLVRALNNVEETKELFDEANTRLVKSGKSATFYSSLTNPSTRFVNSLIYAGVGVVGAMQAISGTISVGSLTSFLGYASSYAKPFNEITGVFAEMQNAIACGQRLFELIDAESEEDVLNAVSEEVDGKQENAVESATNNEVPEDTAADLIRGQVDFSHVYFSYDKSKSLIEDLNLSVEPGQRVAIVGPTGSGKTTIINLLMRFYELDGGEIKVDGKNIREIPRDTLRSYMGMVLQETWLFQGTIYENLKIGNPEATREEVEQAAKAAMSHEFIRRLPKGYDTPLSQAAESISQGQRQLLCITRLMMHLPPILILDEATSSIDTRTEQKIQKAFHRMMKGRTTFIVAHRLSTILDSDVILYLEDGHVKEQGSHEELLKKNGSYAALYRSQFM